MVADEAPPPPPAPPPAPPGAVPQRPLLLHVLVMEVPSILTKVHDAPASLLAQASVDLNSPSRQILKNVCDGIEIVMIFFLLAPVLAPVLGPLLSAGKERVQSSFFGERSAMSMHTVHAESGELSAPLVPEHSRGVV